MSLIVNCKGIDYKPKNEIELAKYKFFGELLREVERREDVEIWEHELEHSLRDAIGFLGTGPSITKTFLKINRKNYENIIYFEREVMLLKKGIKNKAVNTPDNPHHHIYYFEVDLLGMIEEKEVLSTLSFESRIFGPKMWVGYHLYKDLDDNTFEEINKMAKFYYSKRLEGEILEEYSKLLNELKEELRKK